MKRLLVVLTALFSFSAHSECTAPESVKALTDLISKIFDGSSITCDDGSEFSAKYIFECNGDSYFTVKPDDSLNTLPDGSEVYVVNKLSEVNGQVKLSEMVFDTAEGYRSGLEPTQIIETNFIPYSKKSFGFYSTQSPSDASWLSSTWYLKDGQDKVYGYKLYSNRAVSCSGN